MYTSMLMHLKCIYVLCNLLCYITSYLHHIRCYNHVLEWFYWFPYDFPFNYYNNNNPARHKKSRLHFLTVRDHSRTQKDLGPFICQYFIKNEVTKHLDLTWVRQKAKIGSMVWLDTLAMACGIFGTSWLSCRPSSRWSLRLDLKHFIKGAQIAISEHGAHETQN
jgi:hypothetical protein